ncbi:MauE/DoxX family redox-associated membrane protein [candidate division KSB1 bacterium]
MEKFNIVNGTPLLVGTYLFSSFEIALGLLIMVRLNKKVIAATISLLAVFSVFLSFKVITQDPVTCSCFGNFLFRSNLNALIQDLCFLGGTIYLL